MNRSILNLVLLVAAIGLGTAVWYTAKKDDQKGPPLTTLAPDAVTKVTIEHPGSSKIELAKTGAGWQLTAPVKAEADPAEVSSLTLLAGRETRQTLDRAAISLPELKLEPADFTLSLNGVAIAFGTVEPLQYRRYVKTGENVYLIEDLAGASTDADYSDLVAKNLVPAGSEIERIELPKLALAKDGAGHWALIPADPKVSADQMQRLADAWRGARAMWNEQVKDPSKIRGEHVRIAIKGAGAREFVVAERDPQFKLYRPDLGVSFVLSKALEDEMLKLPEPPPPPPAPEDKKDATPPAAVPAEPPKK